MSNRARHRSPARMPDSHVSEGFHLSRKGNFRFLWRGQPSPTQSIWLEYRMVCSPFLPYQEWALGLAWANGSADGQGSQCGARVVLGFRKQKLFFSVRISKRELTTLWRRWLRLGRGCCSQIQLDLNLSNPWVDQFPCGTLL